MNVSKKSLKKMIFPLGIVVSCLFLQLTSIYSYLLFHTLIELFAVVIAFGIFVVAWSSRSFVKNNFLLILGIGYFFVGGIDLLHTLSYKGMLVFNGVTSNISTQLWIIARYAEALTFIGAIVFFYDDSDAEEKRKRFNAGMVLLIYALIFLLTLILVFYWNIVPIAYVEGVGLTFFKIISEYVISGIFILVTYLLYKKRKMFDPKIFNLISLALLVKVISEFFFVGYVGVYDFANMLGHLFKFISFLLMYKAILEIGLMNPYRFLFYDLKKSQEEYLIAQNELQQRIRDDLTDAYRHVGIANRKISMILEIERHSHHKKNKSELIKYIANVAKNACHAYAALIYKHEKDDLFRLVIGNGIHKSAMHELSIVNVQHIDFLRNMINEQKRINASCEFCDVGCFNNEGNLTYFVAVPFIVERTCKGFMFLGFEERKSIAQQELDFLDVFSMHISSALAKLEVIRGE